MEACNFGHRPIVDLLLRSAPTLDLDAVNLRGQTASEVAASRGYDDLAAAVDKARHDAENPEEMPDIIRMEQEVVQMKDFAWVVHFPGFSLNNGFSSGEVVIR